MPDSDKMNCRCELCDTAVSMSVPLNNGFRGRLCQRCDFVMTEMNEGAGSLPEINSSFYPLEERVRTYYSRSREFELKYGQLLTLLQTNLPGKRLGSVLEIGSNIGFLAHYMVRHGIAVTSVELNETLRDFQRLVYHINAVEKMDEIPAGQKHDAIILMDVLEHIASPAEFLKGLLNSLNEGGIVFIQFPNKNSLSARLSGSNWGWWQAPDHRFHFSAKAVRTIAEKTGLEVRLLSAVSPLLDDLISLPRIGRLFMPLQRINRSLVLNRFVAWKRGSLLQVILQRKS